MTSLSRIIHISLFLLLNSTVAAQNFQPIIGLEYNFFHSVFHSFSVNVGVTYQRKLDASILYNYNWYYNPRQAKYYKLGLDFSSIGFNLSYRPLSFALSPRFEASYAKGISTANNGPILGYSGYPTNITDSLSYLGKFESLRWSVKIGGGLDYSWKNFNIYLGLGYQWWKFNINKDFYHNYLSVNHKGWYYNARISYRFGKNEKN